MKLVRISPSPPYFKGLLKNSNPFFIGGTLTIGDLIGDCSDTPIRLNRNVIPFEKFLLRRMVHN